MPLTSAQQAALSAAIDRLQNYYDGDNPYNPSTNPGGFRQGGQVVNFEPALKDTATVMNLASILVSDATAAATNSPKAVRVDSALSFTEIERGQGRANIVAAPKSVSTSGNFSASDIGAPIRTSGTITRTLPSAGLVPAGWATGVVENAGSGVVTIAPANGEVLEGVVNNTIKLLSKQRAYFYLDTDGWHIGWVDRCPIIASKAISTPASSIDLPMPVSYGAFELSITGLRVSAVGNLVGIFSTDSGGTFLSAASAYINTIVFGSSTGGSGTAQYQVAAGPNAGLGATLAPGNTPYTGAGIISPGSASSQATIQMNAGHALNAGGVIGRTSFCNYTSNLLMNLIRIAVDAGNMVEGFATIRGMA